MHSGTKLTTESVKAMLAARLRRFCLYAFVNGNFAFSVMDTDGATKFSGPDNIMYFFIA
jgi:hypothetical protein